MAQDNSWAVARGSLPLYQKFGCPITDGPPHSLLHLHFSRRSEWRFVVGEMQAKIRRIMKRCVRNFEVPSLLD
jgi:hypothetical protein